MTTRRSIESGFALLEVLVSLLVLSFGMLGIAGLLLTTSKSNTSSVMKQQAIQSAYNVVDRMRANKAQAAAHAYDLNNLTTSGPPAAPSAPGADCGTQACTPAQLAVYDTAWWQSELGTDLPVGSGAIATTAAGPNTQVTVTVQWDDSAAAATLGAAASSPAGAPPHKTFALITVSTLL